MSASSLILDPPDELGLDFARSFAPPTRLTPAEWATEHRVLSRAQSNRWGRWDNGAAPYLVGIMNAAVLPGVQQVAVRKAAQIGVAEREPDPILIA